MAPYMCDVTYNVRKRDLRRVSLRKLAEREALPASLAGFHLRLVVLDLLKGRSSLQRMRSARWTCWCEATATTRSQGQGAIRLRRVPP